MDKPDAGHWPMSINDMKGCGYTDEWIGLSFRIAIRMQANAKRQMAEAIKAINNDVHKKLKHMLESASPKTPYRD